MASGTVGPRRDRSARDTVKGSRATIPARRAPRRRDHLCHNVETERLCMSPVSPVQAELHRSSMDSCLEPPRAIDQPLVNNLRRMVRQA